MSHPEDGPAVAAEGGTAHGAEEGPEPDLHHEESLGSGDEFVEVDGIMDLTVEPRGHLDLNVEPELEVDISTIGIPQSNNNRRSKKMITNAQRDAVYKALLTSSNNGKLGKKNTTIVAQNLGVGLRTVQRLWKDAKRQIAEGLEVDVSHKKTNRVGRKKCDIDLSQIPSIALRKRTTLKSLAGQLHCSVSTLHRRFKMGMIRRHSSAAKPSLKEENKRSRLQFSYSMLDQNSINSDPKFIDMHNIVHIDEKWFYMTKKNKKYYLLPEEDDPHRTLQNKNSIGKVMFLAMVAMPRHDEHGNETFSGKLGIFLFVREEPAPRSSRNRPRGTIIQKPVIVNRDVMRDYVINKVIPAIQAYWPEEDAGKPIFIQQDNARTHVLPTDPEFHAAVQQTGLDVRLMYQPANSPDMNVLDLGFFSSIQSLTDKCDPRTIEDLIRDVLKEYDEYDSYYLKKVYITLQSCMIETMKCDGGNEYKVPHMNKDRLERIGALPTRLSCDLSLCQRVKGILDASP